VRRLLAISLLLLFMVPCVLPLFGANAAEAALPACCRRNGKHHCMMDMAWSQERSFHTVREKCPYSVAPPAILVLPSYTPSAAASIFAGIRRHPSVAAQTEAQYRISFDRSRQKRGPPIQIA
jgi:hypothetical protein